MKRTLSLKRESLAELAAADLSAVNGAGYAASGATCPLDDCFDDLSRKIGCVGTYQCPTWTC